MSLRPNLTRARCYRSNMHGGAEHICPDCIVAPSQPKYLWRPPTDLDPYEATPSVIGPHASSSRRLLSTRVATLPGRHGRCDPIMHKPATSTVASSYPIVQTWPIHLAFDSSSNNLLFFFLPPLPFAVSLCLYLIRIWQILCGTKHRGSSAHQ